ncbi:hypothetical protein BDV97DRAFT_350351 [Delphinella strobiligena]|nr:hypothetical protein BDV97DRAFT_350351 [Delphinella strobiligena]
MVISTKLLPFCKVVMCCKSWTSSFLHYLFSLLLFTIPPQEADCGFHRVMDGKHATFAAALSAAITTLKRMSI